jgi:hypothetical protein
MKHLPMAFYPWPFSTSIESACGAPLGHSGPYHEWQVDRVTCPDCLSMFTLLRSPIAA